MGTGTELRFTKPGEVVVGGVYSAVAGDSAVKVGVTSAGAVGVAGTRSTGALAGLLVDASGNLVVAHVDQDGTITVPIVNLQTGALTNIPHAESRIYRSEHFMYTDAFELGSAATQDFLIVPSTDTTWAHMMFFMDGSAITQFQLYEDCTRTGDTDAETAGNNNRNSTDAPVTTIYKGTSTDGSDGNLVHEYKGGAAAQQSRQASGSGHDSMLILKQGSKYLLRYTSGSASNLCNLRLEWFEFAHQT